MLLQLRVSVHYDHCRDIQFQRRRTGTDFQSSSSVATDPVVYTARTIHDWIYREISGTDIAPDHLCLACVHDIFHQ